MKKVKPFYKSAAWLKCRDIILKRDGYLCQPCLRAGKPEWDATGDTVHHIKSLVEHPELALDEDNLETICRTCHNKEHPEKGEGKKKKSGSGKVKIIKFYANEERT